MYIKKEKRVESCHAVPITTCKIQEQRHHFSCCFQIIIAMHYYYYKNMKIQYVL